MTLNKAINELFEELHREDLTEAEKKALSKYQRWLTSIKTTVSNNTDTWHPFPQESPIEEGKYLVTLSDNFYDNDEFVDIMYWTGKQWMDFSIGVPERNIMAWKELPNPYKP